MNLEQWIYSQEFIISACILHTLRQTLSIYALIFSTHSDSFSISINPIGQHRKKECFLQYITTFMEFAIKDILMATALVGTEGNQTLALMWSATGLGLPNCII